MMSQKKEELLFFSLPLAYFCQHLRLKEKRKSETEIITFVTVIS